MSFLERSFQADFARGECDLRGEMDRSTSWAPAVAALVAATFYLLATRHGIGLLPDSLRYMGMGFIPDDAPIYGAILRGLAQTGINITVVARALGLFLICANVVATWLLLKRGDTSFATASIALALILLSPQFFGWHVVAMSEPLFILCLLTTAAMLFSFLEQGGTARLLACSIALGTTTLVRFPGVVLGIPIVLLLWARHEVPRAERMREFLVATLPGAAIVLTWAILSQILAGHSVGRDFTFYGSPDAELWLSSLRALSAFLLPTAVPFLPRMVVLIATLASVAVVLFHSAQAYLAKSAARHVDARRSMPVFFAIFSLAYFGFSLLSVLIEANLPLLNGRYGLPLFVCLVLATAVGIANIPTKATGGHLTRNVLLVVSVIVLASHVVRSGSKVVDLYRDGAGFADSEWTQSPTAAAARQLPGNKILYSNAADFLVYSRGRPAQLVPMRFARRTGRDMPSSPYAKQLETARSDLLAGRAYFVFFDRLDWRFYLASEKELKNKLPLRLIGSYPDGRIYAGPDLAGTSRQSSNRNIP